MMDDFQPLHLCRCFLAFAIFALFLAKLTFICPRHATPWSSLASLICHSVILSATLTFICHTVIFPAELTFTSICHTVVLLASHVYLPHHDFLAPLTFICHAMIFFFFLLEAASESLTLIAPGMPHYDLFLAPCHISATEPAIYCRRVFPARSLPKVEGSPGFDGLLEIGYHGSLRPFPHRLRWFLLWS